MNVRRSFVRGLSVAALAMSPLLVAHAAYRGHATDADYNALLAYDASLRGTAADSCVTCHRAGNVPDPGKPGGMRRENHCEYCHAVHVYGKGEVRQTLNSFGIEYLVAGRGVDAIKVIGANDSDGDGVTNQAELTKGTNPGDAASNPSLPIAPFRVLSSTEMAKLAPIATEVLLVNTSLNPSGDSYDSYRGYRLYELLQAVGISETATASTSSRSTGSSGPTRWTNWNGRGRRAPRCRGSARPSSETVAGPATT